MSEWKEHPVVWRIGREDAGPPLEPLYSEGRKGQTSLGIAVGPRLSPVDDGKDKKRSGVSPW